MLLNNNIVLEIIDSNFMDKVMECCEDAIMQMDDTDFMEYFDEDVENAYLDTIYGVNVEQYEDEESDGIQEVLGILELDVLVNGYVYWDGEDIHIGDAEMILGFSFSFQINLEKNEAELFDITWEY